MLNDPSPTLECMEDMLRQCRGRIVTARIKDGLREALRGALNWLSGIAAVFLILRILAWAFGTPAPAGRHLAAMAALAAVVFLGRGMARRKPVRIVEAAERLDLAQSTHNRIATAMALLKSGDDSPFARAAIRDGWETLDRLKSESPQSDWTPLSWHRAGLCLAVALVMVLLGFLMSPKHRTGDTSLQRQAAPGIAPWPSPDATDALAEAPNQTIARAESAPRATIAARPKTTAEIKSGEQPEAAAGARSEGTTARPASGESRSSQTASTSNSAANGSGAKSEPGTNEPSKPPKPRDAKRQTAGQPKANPQEEKKGGSISARGSSGAGSMQSAQNEWSSNVKAKSDESDDFREDEEPDEEMDPDKQRLGAQPALKNRASQVSRELSLVTGLETANQQNRGRGGPGGQKKSRGTATMIMGVPIPGFVRGRLLPGPTKSTQEEIEPSPVEAGYATATAQPQANPEEEPQERYHPAAANSLRARQYLLNTHDEHDHTLNQADADK